jgi:hypothetical protein
MNPFLKAMQPPKKRPVDPNAPPRPNLLSHDKVIREANTLIGKLENDVLRLRQRVDSLEAKLSNQTAYLQALHQTVSSKRRG